MIDYEIMSTDDHRYFKTAVYATLSLANSYLQKRERSSVNGNFDPN